MPIFRIGVLLSLVVLLFFSPAFAIELVPYQVGLRTESGEAIEVYYGLRKPDRIIPRMTLVTDKGAYPINFQKTVQKCVPVSTSLKPICRYRWQYRLGKEVKGKYLFALEGTRRISNVTPIEFPEKKPLRDIREWIIHEPVQVDYPRKWWFQFDNIMGTDKYVLMRRGDISDWGPLLTLKSCKIRSYQKFTGIYCSGREEVVLLYEGKRLVLVSIGEYSIARADLLATFMMDNQRYYAFRLGIKGGEPVAMLTKEAGAWKVFIRRAYTATYC